MKYIYTILIVAALIGCNSTTEVGKEFKSLTLNVSQYENDIYDFVDTVEIVPVIDKLSLIEGYPEDLLRVDSLLALVDYNVNDEIYLLNSNMEVERVISRKGEGPTEYRDIYSLVYNSDRELFTVMDLNKMVEIDKNGRHIRSVRFDYFPDRLDLHNNTYIIWNNDRPLEDEYFRFYELTDDYEVKSRQIPFAENESQFSREPIHSVISNNEKIYFTSWMNDTLYHKSKTSQNVEKTILKFEDQSPNNVLHEGFQSARDIDDYMANNDTWIWECPLMTDDYFAAVVSKRGVTKLLIQEIKSKQGYISSTNVSLTDALFLYSLKSKSLVEGNHIQFLAESELIGEFQEACNNVEDPFCTNLKMVNLTDNSNFYIIKIALKDVL